MRESSSEQEALEPPPWLTVIREEGARGYRDGRSRGHLQVQYRWSEGLHVGYFLAAGVSGVMIWGAWRSGIDQGLEPARIVGLTLLSLLLGVPLYLFAAKFLNSTTLIVDAAALRVRHGPLPWSRPEDIALSRISRFFTTVLPRRDGRLLDFRLHVLFRNREERLLISGFADAPSAQAVEDLLTAHLGLRHATLPRSLDGRET